MLKDYVVLDLEMTGLSAKTDRIIEIGALRIRDGKEIERMECLVNPKCKIPERVTELTGITGEMVAEGEEKDEAIGRLLDFLEGEIWVGQNLAFDYSFLKQWAVNHKRPLQASACDTLKIARVLLPAEESKKLESLCAYFGIERTRGHRAMDDVIETWQVFECLQKMAEGKPEYAACFEPKPLVYRAKKQTPATAHQLQRLKEYCDRHHLTDAIEWENLTRSEASRIMDRYRATYGP